MAFHGGQSYVGVDIGGASLKIVELKNEKGRPKLMTYGYIEKPSPVLKVESTEAKQKIIETLKNESNRGRLAQLYSIFLGDHSTGNEAERSRCGGALGSQKNCANAAGEDGVIV